MASSESTLRYIKVDYQAHKDALLSRVRARWPGRWNDFLSNSFGVVLVDLVAWAMATTAFMINRLAAENYIGTMTLRESAVRIGALTGYRLRNPIGATVYCETSISNANAADIVIAQGTQVRASDAAGTPFEVAMDYTIEAGQLTPRIPVVTFSVVTTGQGVLNSLLHFELGSSAVDVVDNTIDLSQSVQSGQSISRDGSAVVYTIVSVEAGDVNPYTRLILDRPCEEASGDFAAEVFDQRILLTQGQSVSDRFVAPTQELLTPGFTVQLVRKPVLEASVTVSVNGVQWTRVAEIGMAQPDAEAYTVKTFASGLTCVVFGDGRFGKAVPTDAAIIVDYRVGGGLAGNIALGQIDTSVIGITADTSSPISVSLKNQTATGTGGMDAETLEEARTAIPYYTRTGGRCVTIDDYQTMAQRFDDDRFGAVAFARASVRKENAFLEGNIVTVYAWTTGAGGGLVNLTLPHKTAVQTYLQELAVGTDYVLMLDGSSRPVPVALRFKVIGGYAVADVAENVRDTVSAYIAALRPGQPLLYSNFVRALDETAGVDTLNMATPIADLLPSGDYELFTVPDDTFVYAIDRSGIGAGSVQVDNVTTSISLYRAQLPIFPLSAWSLRLFLGSSELSILPYYRAGFARLIGSVLSTDETVDSDGDGLPDYHSTVNLLTGEVRLCVVGVAGDLTMRLTSISGYSTERALDAYIGYTGDNTLTKRREIRTALRAWSGQHGVGQAMYARRVEGIDASASAVTNVVASISGVTAVTRVALDFPSSTDDRVSASDYELLRLGNVYINNQSD